MTMPKLSGFAALATLPEERISDKITRRIAAGEQGMIVWWSMKAGAQAAAQRGRQKRTASSSLRRPRRRHSFVGDRRRPRCSVGVVSQAPACEIIPLAANSKFAVLEYRCAADRRLAL